MGNKKKIDIHKIIKVRAYSSSEVETSAESRSSRQARTIIKCLFFVVMVLAFFLRFYKLGEIPPSLNWDEAALGYNAYSILKTGNDEYGVRFPLVFRSFGDYKPPFYTYLTIPSILIFGLNEFAVRFPSALFGSLTVLITYFLVKEIFPRKNFQFSIFNFQLITSFLLAISPWHLQFSRGAFEANLGLFLAVLGTYLFLKGLRRKALLPASAIIFSLSLYAYHSSRIFVPLLVLTLALLYRKELFETKKWVTLSILIGLIITLPLIKLFTQGQVLTRFSGVSAFADPSVLDRSIRKIEEDNNSFLARLIHNRRWIYFLTFLENYLSHFDPNFLFIEGNDNPRHHTPGNGLLYYWEILTIPAGIYCLFQLKGRAKWIILAFLFLGPIAAAPAKAAPHAIRSLNSLPGWIIISSLGLAFLFDKSRAGNQSHTMSFQRKTVSFQRKLESIQFRALLVIFILGNFIYWANLYFIHLPLETSQAWQYGYRQVIAEVNKIEKDYDKVMVTAQYDQPYIFFLFYKKYDPLKYQSEYGNPKELPRYERNFGRYQFVERIDLAKVDKKDKFLIVGTPEEVGERDNFRVIKKIDFLDSSPAFLIGEKI